MGERLPWPSYPYGAVCLQNPRLVAGLCVCVCACLSLNSAGERKHVPATSSKGHGKVSLVRVTLPGVITEAFWVARIPLQGERGLLERLIVVQLWSNH